MKTISSRMTRGIMAGALAASSCLAWVAVSHAQTSTQAAPAPKGLAMHDMQGMHEMHGMRHMHMMRELARLKTSLRLTPEQAALWDRAEQQTKPDADVREQMKARHGRMTAMLDDPNFDPRKLAAEVDSVQTERMAKHKSTREAWFAVYDKLNPAQRGQVREFLRARMARGEHMGERRGKHVREHMGWMQPHEMQPGQEKAAPPSR